MSRTIIGFLGELIILVGLSMCVPLMMSIYDNEHIQNIYILAIIVTLICGCIFFRNWSWAKTAYANSRWIHAGYIGLAVCFFFWFVANDYEWLLPKLFGCVF